MLWSRSRYNKPAPMKLIETAMMIEHIGGRINGLIQTSSLWLLLLNRNLQKRSFKVNLRSKNLKYRILGFDFLLIETFLLFIVLWIIFAKIYDHRELQKLGHPVHWHTQCHHPVIPNWINALAPCIPDWDSIWTVSIHPDFVFKSGCNTIIVKKKVTR